LDAYRLRYLILSIVGDDSNYDEQRYTHTLAFFKSRELFEPELDFFQLSSQFTVLPNKTGKFTKMVPPTGTKKGNGPKQPLKAFVFIPTILEAL
jgi:hypothetical protein